MPESMKKAKIWGKRMFRSVREGSEAADLESRRQAYLEEMGDEGSLALGASDVLELREADLREDGTELARSSRDTVRGGAV